MAKLGYTWYPKDWTNSESVFELNLSERGLYRELIDLAMLNDNSTEIKIDVWIRKFAIDIDSLNYILSKLSRLNLVLIEGEKLFIPSCESRLKLVRGGSNGGKKSKPMPKPTIKPIPKPFGSLSEKNSKPIAKQIEIETKIENKDEVEINPSPSIPCIENENLPKLTTFKQAFAEYWNNQIALEAIALKNYCTVDEVQNSLLIFKEELKASGLKPDDNKLDFGKHFNNWINTPHGKQTLKIKHSAKSAMEIITERERNATQTA